MLDTVTAALTSKQQAWLDAAPKSVRRRFFRLRAAVAAIDSAPARRICRVTKRRARSLALSTHTLHSLRGEYHRRGEIALLDKRFSAACWKSKPASVIPKVAVKQLKALAAKSTACNQAVIRQFLCRVAAGSVRNATPQTPGLSTRNLARYLQDRPNPARVKLFRALLELRGDGKWNVKLWRKIK